MRAQEYKVGMFRNYSHLYNKFKVTLIYVQQEQKENNYHNSSFVKNIWLPHKCGGLHLASPSLRAFYLIFCCIRAVTSKTKCLFSANGFHK